MAEILKTWVTGPSQRDRRPGVWALGFWSLARRSNRQARAWRITGARKPGAGRPPGRYQPRGRPRGEETTLRPPLSADSAQQGCRMETNSKSRPQWFPQGSSASSSGPPGTHEEVRLTTPTLQSRCHPAGARRLRSAYSAAGRPTPDRRPQPGACSGITLRVRQGGKALRERRRRRPVGNLEGCSQSVGDPRSWESSLSG